MKTIPENINWLMSLDETEKLEMKATIDKLPVELTIRGNNSSDVPRLFVHGNLPCAVYIRPMGQCRIESIRRENSTVNIKLISLDGSILHLQYDGCNYWFTLG